MPDTLQTLAVVGRLYPLILSGDKTSTIRWREAEIVPGALKFTSEDDAGKSIVVEVTRCTRLPLSEAAAFVGRAEEWPDAVMLAGMREHYPEITLADTVQVIQFRLR